MNYIAHHGIKGQKWGVRRYQNKDGSYTREGLKRYRSAQEDYMKARSKYEDVKDAYKVGSASKEDLKSARQNLRNANSNANATYRQLRRDVKADRGKKSYSEGNTIEGYRNKAIWTNLGLGAATAASTTALTALGKRAVIKLGNTTVDMPAAEIAYLAGIGAIAASTIIYGKKSKDLRSYYGHSRPTTKPVNND